MFKKLLQNSSMLITIWVQKYYNINH